MIQVNHLVAIQKMKNKIIHMATTVMANTLFFKFVMLHIGSC